MKTVLVTGGCGFIGSHFVHHLLARTDWRVVNLDKLTYAGNLENLKDVEEGPRYRFLKGDICNRELVDELFQQEQPWAVVNFAAESHVDRSILDSSPFIETNIAGVHSLLEVCRQYGIQRFIHISTDEVYGDMEGKEPSTEESPLAPSSPYSASKASADLLCLAYKRTYDVPTIIVRSCNNYGPLQFPEKLLPLIIRNVLMGKELPVYGDGQQRREWIYVQDNVNGILSVLENGTTGYIYNLGTREEQSNLTVVREVCRTISELVGMDLKQLLDRISFVADRPGHDRRYALEAKRIREKLGWNPFFSFETGLRQTVHWYLENQGWVERVTTGEYRNYYKAVYEQAWGDSAS